MPKILIFVVAASLACALFINFCALLFGCGCRSWWSGAAGHCNIHIAESRHCPWCSTGALGGALAFAGILMPQLAISFWPRPLDWKLRLILAVAAFPIFGAIVAAIYGLLTGYWAR